MNDKPVMLIVQEFIGYAYGIAIVVTIVWLVVG